MTYEELWVAQVRAKARGFAHIYSTLRHLIKSRTQAGHIHGYCKEDCIPGDGYLSIHFYTKR